MANPQDILLISNPDIDCNEVDSEKGWNHRDYFQVEWDGHPHRIAPNQERRMPRFLAEHFAKHLANHLLTKQNKPINDAVARPKALAQILKGVEEEFGGEEVLSEGEKAARMVDDLNPAERVMDLGEMPNPVLGALKPAGPSLDEIMKNAGETTSDAPKASEIPTATPTSIWDESKPKPTKGELLKTAFAQGIEISGNETIDQLIGKLKAF